MSLDQIRMFVKSARSVSGTELAALTHVIAMGSRGSDDGLQSFVRTLEES
jgi:hypothetical protein